MRFLPVIELPKRPAIRRVATVTLFAEAPFVHIVMGVAIVATHGSGAVYQRRVALRAADNTVQTEQRILGQVVIERDIRAPGLLTMTGIAIASQLRAVWIFAAMAAGAVTCKLLRPDRCGMARVTVDFRVCPSERKFMPHGVVIDRERPGFIVVAVSARDA